MAYLLVFVLFLLLPTQTKASDFLGNSLSFSVGKENLDGSLEVNIRYREYRNESCGSEHINWLCQSGDCGAQTQSDVLSTEDSSGNDAWCQSDGYMTRKVTSDSTFLLRDTGCCWGSNVHGAHEWTADTLVNVGTRSDTHKPNRSPVSATVPRLRVPQNCVMEIKLLAHDPDGDNVKCKFSRLAGEACASCHAHPNFNLDEELCVLRGNGSVPIGTHVFEMVLEDYPTKDITIMNINGTSLSKSSLNASAMTNPAPISQVPLQFTLEVLSPSENCVSGATRPQFLTPTPSHGEVQVTAVGHMHQLSIRAQSTESRIVDFQISGPCNMSKSLLMEENGVAVATVEWMPHQSDLHHSIPVCFTADTEASQSEMRCVVLTVKQSLPLSGIGKVTCEGNIIDVSVSKASIPGIDQEWLRLNDPSCSLASNDTHVMATISINTCGTVMEEEGDFLVFKNMITSFNNPNSVITRRRRVTIDFQCQYPKVASVHSHYLNTKSDYIFTEGSFGSFGYNFEIFSDSTFSTAIAPETYPVEYEMMQMIYMGIKSHSALPDTKLFVDSCRATPTTNPKSTVYYDLIKNGCLEDETVKTYPGGSTTFDFEIQAFKFTGDFDEVFISCSVILCEANNPNSRCAQGCVKDASRRRKREGTMETASHFLTQGPFRVRRESPGMVDKDLRAASSSSDKANVGTYALASLLAVTLVLLVAVIFYRRQRYRSLSQQNLLF
ncbi:uncharacterized protein LOC134438772 [Engraulis encrasicolus]|uniref:uncharacterized protein LOC134438772 n=1 Tax=Engraulis encrasicolus TaxID=184585 RepID=UPI002FD10817